MEESPELKEELFEQKVRVDVLDAGVRQLVQQVAVLLCEQEVVFVRVPSEIHVVPDAVLELVVEVSALIESLDEQEEELESFLLLYVVLEVLHVAHHVLEFSKHIRENRHAREEHHAAEETLTVSYRVEVSEASGRETCEGIVHGVNCLLPRLSI